MSRNYIIFGTNNDIDDILFSELKEVNNTSLTCMFNGFSKFELLLNTAHYSSKMNKYFSIPFKKIWFKRLFDIKQYDRNDEMVFVYLSDMYYKVIEAGFVEYLRNIFPNSKHVCYALDINVFRKYDFDKIRNKLDASYIFDQEEAKKQDLLYYPLPYSRLNVSDSPNIEYADLCFVGQAKSRFSLLIKIFEYCAKHNITTNFYIIGVKKEEQVYSDNIHYIDYIPYKQSLEVLMKSNCDIELFIDGCTSYSQRVMSAYLYNKKIITNNKFLVESKYYNPNDILYFDDIDSLNPEFIKNKTNPKYRENIFSPVLFLEELGRRLYDE